MVLPNTILSKSMTQDRSNRAGSCQTATRMVTPPATQLFAVCISTKLGMLPYARPLNKLRAIRHATFQAPFGFLNSSPLARLVRPTSYHIQMPSTALHTACSTAMDPIPTTVALLEHAMPAARLLHNCTRHCKSQQSSSHHRPPTAGVHGRGNTVHQKGCRNCKQKCRKTQQCGRKSDTTRTQPHDPSTRKKNAGARQQLSREARKNPKNGKIATCPARKSASWRGSAMPRNFAPLRRNIGS